MRPALAALQEALEPFGPAAPVQAGLVQHPGLAIDLQREFFVAKDCIGLLALIGSGSGSR